MKNNLSNKVQLIGRLGLDPEVKEVTGKRKVARMNLATSEEYYNKAGEKVKETQWHRLVAWDALAEICEKYITKGQEIAVEGKLEYRVYTDKDNVKHFITEVTISELLIISNRKAS
jgi:single-strand DNA-binding protein